jgi:predicted ATPase/DNA-binding winged helix-turn-helix (wHTH) protein
VADLSAPGGLADPLEPGGVEATQSERGCWELDLVQRELRTRGQAVPIGSRAFELLKHLTEAAPQTISKRALTALVWPGLAVEDNTLRVHISATRRALGEDRGLLQTISGRGYRLLGRWTINAPYVRQAPPSGPRGQALPLPSSELIGRSESVEHLAILISAYRVVTLTGPGGIGKTRLSLEVARRQTGEFADGARFVELALLADPALVPSAVASALGFASSAVQHTAQSVARAIGHQGMLLVLDNCEHVIDAAAHMAECLVRNCPNVAILATSRELLRIEGEYVFHVPPLALPSNDEAGGSDLLRHGAIQLFVIRTRAIRTEAGAGDLDIGAVAEICRRLDGIPLAIEFAAARAATLGTEHVRARLGDRLDLLTSGRRTALPRQQTLRATLDWSHELLSEAERVVLRRVAVCVGPFSLAIAAAVIGDVGAGGIGAGLADIGNGISDLCAKSLIAIDGAPSDGRWRLLETIRTYALENLAVSGEAQETARRHARFFLDQVTRRAAGQTRPGRLRELGRDIANVRAALEWAFSDAGDAVLGAALTAGFVPVWLRLGLVAECRAAVERAHGMCGTDLNTRTAMRLNIALGLLQSYRAEPATDQTAEILRQCLAAAERLDDGESQILALWGLLTLSSKAGDHRAVLGFAQGIQAAGARSGDAMDIAVGNRALGTALYYTGNQAAARRCLERVLDLPAEVQREEYEAWLLTDLRLQSEAVLARVLVVQGRADLAVQHARACFEQARAADSKMSICYTLRYAVCGVSLTLGDMVAAESAVAMLLDVAHLYKFSLWIMLADCLDGMLMIRRGDLAPGAVRLRTAIAVNSKLGFTLCYPEMLGFLVDGLIRLGQFGEAESNLRTALDWSRRTGEAWYLPELLRLEGQLALRSPDSDQAAAESAFLGAIELAREQDARLWELRAACDLARLRLDQHRRIEAQHILAPVLADFPGCGFADAAAARELLDRIGDQAI